MTSINAVSSDVWPPPLTSARNTTMSSKGQIFERLGESGVLPPELIGDGLTANERANCG
jgi:hypothetical protein